jgi:antitoxin HigA-1
MTNGAFVLSGQQKVQNMSKSSIIIKPKTPNRVTTSPGEILLEEFMKPLGLTANALSLALRVPANRLGAIIKRERGVTADTALRLARYFGTTPQFWLYAQAAYDLSLVQKEIWSEIQTDVRPRAA